MSWVDTVKNKTTKKMFSSLYAAIIALNTIVGPYLNLTSTSDLSAIHTAQIDIEKITQIMSSTQKEHTKNMVQLAMEGRKEDLNNQISSIESDPKKATAILAFIATAAQILLDKDPHKYPTGVKLVELILRTTKEKSRSRGGNKDLDNATNLATIG